MSEVKMTVARLRQRHKFMCKWKKQFATEKLANIQMAEYLKRPNVQRPEALNVYKCLNGDHWHVGHKPEYPLETLFGVVGNDKTRLIASESRQVLHEPSVVRGPALGDNPADLQ